MSERQLPLDVVVSIIVFGEIHEDLDIGILGYVDGNNIDEGLSIEIEGVGEFNAALIPKMMRVTFRDNWVVDNGLKIYDVELKLKGIVNYIIVYYIQYLDSIITFEQLYNRLENMECSREIAKRRDFLLEKLSYMVM